MSTEEASTRKLILYVAGETPKSLAAISNLERICRESIELRSSTSRRTRNSPANTRSWRFPLSSESCPFPFGRLSAIFPMSRRF